MFITIIDKSTDEIKTWEVKRLFTTPSVIDDEIRSKGHDPKNCIITFSCNKPKMFVEKSHSEVDKQTPEEPITAMIDALYANIAKSVNSYEFIRVFTSKLTDVKSLIYSYQNLPRTLRSKAKISESLTEALFAIHMLAEFYDVSDSVFEDFILNLKSHYKDLTE